MGSSLVLILVDIGFSLELMFLISRVSRIDEIFVAIGNENFADQLRDGWVDHLCVYRWDGKSWETNYG